MEIKVTGCETCPMHARNNAILQHYCGHPKSGVLLDTVDELLEQCPLKTEPITIVLNEKG